MLNLTQFLITKFFPKFFSFLTKIIYSGRRISFGENFKCDSIPRIIVDKNCTLKIGDNVELKRNVEIRSHGKSQIIVENNIRIDRGVRILAANNAVIHIKEKTRIGLYSVFNGGDSITIGEKTLISGFVYIQTSNHGFTQRGVSVQEQGYEHAPIIIEKDSWLASHVVIMPGIILKQGTVVGSNAVVTKNTEEFQVVAGIPAKPIKERI